MKLTNRKNKYKVKKRIQTKHKGVIKLTNEAIMARREYQKKWRDKNKEKVRLNNEKYWEKKAKKLNEK